MKLLGRKVEEIEDAWVKGSQPQEVVFNFEEAEDIFYKRRGKHEPKPVSL